MLPNSFVASLTLGQPRGRGEGDPTRRIPPSLLQSPAPADMNKESREIEKTYWAWTLGTIPGQRVFTSGIFQYHSVVWVCAPSMAIGSSQFCLRNKAMQTHVGVSYFFIRISKSVSTGPTMMEKCRCTIRTPTSAFPLNRKSGVILC